MRMLNKRVTKQSSIKSNSVQLETEIMEWKIEDVEQMEAAMSAFYEDDGSLQEKEDAERIEAAMSAFYEDDGSLQEKEDAERIEAQIEAWENEDFEKLTVSSMVDEIHMTYWLRKEWRIIIARDNYKNKKYKLALTE